MLLQHKAILVADAHENDRRRTFWNFLQALKRGEITTSQLILMGDIFDLLIGEIAATHDFARPYINLLEELSLQMQIIYLEGNHDFNLSYLFKRVEIFSLKQQPLKLKIDFQEQNIYLAHGDIFLNPLLEFSLKSLRNHYLLVFLNFLNQMSCHYISNKILKNQYRKNLFYKIEDFENLAKKRYEKYKTPNSWVCEGHYHQNIILEDVKYCNLASFAYEGSYFVVECQGEMRFQEQKLRGKDVW